MFFDQNKKIKNVKSLPGFLELNPSDQITFSNFKKQIAETYEKYGFIPLENQTIERTEILFAKTGGDTEKEVYKIKKGDNDLALRFDLTVPLARYVSANYNEITFPFRRYQIEKVFRGERPQKGRFREMYQCDIDIIGDGNLSLKNDAEIPAVIYDIFSKMNIGPFIIKINNRKILSGFLDEINLNSKNTEILRLVDKLAKIGEENVRESLQNLDVSKNQVDEIMSLVSITGTNDEIISQLEKKNIENDDFVNGVQELKEVVKIIELFNVPEDYYQIDLKIVRGLDYYTGTVYETYSVDYPEFGAIASGGRYDNLASAYTNKKLMGVGVSIGLTRLFSQLKAANLLETEQKTVSELLIIPLVEDMEIPIKISRLLRRENIKTEIYFEEKSMKKKLDYANKKGIKKVLIVGDNEIRDDKFTLKDMETGEQKQISINSIADSIKSSS